MSGAVMNQHSNVGFYQAPVSKSLLVVVGGTHVATHVPSLASVFRRIFAMGSFGSIDSAGSVLRIVTSKFVFPDAKSTVLALVLIYFFRIFERRFGSLKFSSSLMLCWTLGVSLDLLVTSLLELPLSSGPLPLLLPLFVPFYQQVPLTSSAMFGPVPVSTKSLTYLLGAQLAFSSPSTLVSTLVSLLVGSTVFLTPLSNLVILPPTLARLLDRILGPMVRSGPPSPGPGLLGATLEIQRTQQAEAIEQQLLRSRARFNVPVGGRQMRLDELWQGGQVRRGPRGEVQGPRGVVQASPEMVTALADMGFARQRAEAALVEANNDIDQATNILLRDM